MFQIAIQMLMGDKVKYFILICALSFSTLLMVQQSGIFWGVMRWTASMMRNSKAPIWVADPGLVKVSDSKPMRDTDLARVRSVHGVEWAMPLYVVPQILKLYNGKFLNIQLTGVDDSTLLGLPQKLIEGNYEDLWKSDGVILDAVVVEQISHDLDKPIGVGDLIDINDHELKVVGIVKGDRALFGSPSVYTTYSRAIEVAPPTRRHLSYVLVHPKQGENLDVLTKRIEAETNLKAFTEEKLFWSTLLWFTLNTGIPLSFFTTILLGFIVGIVVSGQTFYSFVYENIGDFGALKAMGASNGLLQRMILVQAITAGFIGYGIGLFLTALFGFLTMTSTKLPFFLSWQTPLITFILILFICISSASIGIRKISKIDPAEVFRE